MTLRLRAAAFPLLVLIAFGCRDQRAVVHTDVEEWRLVLHAKKAALRADSPAIRQEYAARLLRFVQSHPDHARAREVYDELELTLASERSASGDYGDALRYLRDLASRRPHDRNVAEKIAAVLDLQSVDRQELSTVRVGAGHDEVRSQLGPPSPGWSRRGVAAQSRYESWFYPNAEGGVAAVHFDGNRVIARDYDSGMKALPKRR